MDYSSKQLLSIEVDTLKTQTITQEILYDILQKFLNSGYWEDSYASDSDDDGEDAEYDDFDEEFDELYPTFSAAPLDVQHKKILSDLHHTEKLLLYTKKRIARLMPVYGIKLDEKYIQSLMKVSNPSQAKELLGWTEAQLDSLPPIPKKKYPSGIPRRPIISSWFDDDDTEPAEEEEEEEDDDDDFYEEDDEKGYRVVDRIPALPYKYDKKGGFSMTSVADYSKHFYAPSREMIGTFSPEDPPEVLVFDFWGVLNTMVYQDADDNFVNLMNISEEYEILDKMTSGIDYIQRIFEEKRNCIVAVIGDNDYRSSQTTHGPHGVEFFRYILKKIIPKQHVDKIFIVSLKPTWHDTLDYDPDTEHLKMGKNFHLLLLRHILYEKLDLVIPASYFYFFHYNINKYDDSIEQAKKQGYKAIFTKGKLRGT